MADATVSITDESKSLTIPEEVKTKFPELLEMIQASQSMDDDERQYWIDVLPIMSEDQILNLRGILDNEKKQLAEAEKTYASEMNEASSKASEAFDEAGYLEKKRARVEAEKAHEIEEAEHEKNLLAELENL